MAVPDASGNKGGTVEIPGEVTWAKTHGIAPVAVRLPLTATSSVRWMIFLCALAAVVSLPASIVLFSAPIRQGDEHGWTSIALAIVLLLFAIFSFAKLFSFVADALRSRPTLLIDGEGLRDQRGQTVVLWRDVEWLAFYRRGKVLMAAFGVRLPRAASRRLFQPEALVRWTPENEVHMLLEYLDKPASTVAEVMKALVRQHGGRVEDVYKSNGRLRL